MFSHPHLYPLIPASSLFASVLVFRSLMSFWSISGWPSLSSLSAMAAASFE
jgi:hypothetical protein